MPEVTVRLVEDIRQRGVRRTGATLLQRERGLRVIDEHLRIRLSAPHPMPLLADVLVAGWPQAGLDHAGIRRTTFPEGTARAEGASDEAPARFVAWLADCHPGALVVAVYRGPYCWLRLGGGARTLVRRPDWPVQSWAVWASVAHAWLVAGLRPEAFDPATVRVTRAVRGYSPAVSPLTSSDASRPGASGTGGFPVPVAPGEPVGSRAPSQVRTSSASADCDRPTEEYRDSASR